jgi:ribosome-associated protein
VNKVETKVELEFDVASSESLSDNDKAKILHNYKNLVAGTLIKITGTEHRTQLRNKEAAGEKLIALLNKLLKPTKKRLATKPGKAAKEKKLKFKKIKSEKKQLRQKIR